MRHTSQQFRGSRSRWLEVLVITAGAPLLGSLLSASDPYLVRAPFPWLLMAPLLVALQHGLWCGLVSAALLSAGAYWQVLALGAFSSAFASWSCGLGLVALCAGQLRDSTRARGLALAERCQELEDRVERSERSRHVLQLSHTKLVERVAATRTSLAASVDRAQARMSEAYSMDELGQVLLDVLAGQASLHAASLYIAGRDPCQLVARPIARFGGDAASSAGHSLVMRAFNSGKLTAIVDDGSERADHSVLAAVPLVTSNRKVVGVVAVHALPFMSFQAEQLQQLFVLAGHLTDMLFDRWSSVHDGLRASREPSILIDRAALLDALPATIRVDPAQLEASVTRPLRGTAARLPQAPAPAGFAGLPLAGFKPGLELRSRTTSLTSATVTQRMHATAPQPAAATATTTPRSRGQNSAATARSSSVS